jgi:hypothetical protein
VVSLILQQKIVLDEAKVPAIAHASIKSSPVADLTTAIQDLLPTASSDEA